MKEGSLLYFPDGAAKMAKGDRMSFGSSSQLAEPLVAVDTIASVKSVAGRNVTLQTAEKQLQGPAYGRFETKGHFLIKDITRFALPLTTFEDLANNKETVLYQAWREVREQHAAYIPVKVIPGETIADDTCIPPATGISELPVAPRFALSPDDPIVDDFIAMERRGLGLG